MPSPFYLWVLDSHEAGRGEYKTPPRFLPYSLLLQSTKQSLICSKSCRDLALCIFIVFLLFGPLAVHFHISPTSIARWQAHCVDHLDTGLSLNTAGTTKTTNKMPIPTYGAAPLAKTFVLVRGLSLVAIVLVVGLTANFVSEIVSTNVDPPKEIVGTLTIVSQHRSRISPRLLS